jgi:hypothetical protein
VNSWVAGTRRPGLHFAVFNGAVTPEEATCD